MNVKRNANGDAHNGAKAAWARLLALAFVLVPLLLSSAAYALTNVTSCGTLSSQGETYMLNQSINNTGATCITIGAANITLDCQGFSIWGNNATSTYGVYSTYINSTVKNCNVSNFSRAIYFASGSNNGTISNNTLSGSRGDVLRFDSSNLWMVNNTITCTYQEAVVFANGANNTLQGGSINATGTTAKGVRIQSSGSGNQIIGVAINATYYGVSNTNGPNLTVDCQGASIQGANLTSTYGISNSVLNATVRNCNISNYYYGIYYNGAANGTIAGNNVSAGYGIILNTGGNHTVANNTAFSASGAAIALTTSNFNLVQVNNASSSTGYGILLSNANNNSVIGNFANSTYGVLPAVLNSPIGIAYSSLDGYLYFADNGNNMVRRLNITTNNTTAYLGWLDPGYINATGTAARFNGPFGICNSSSGLLYIADQSNFRIRVANLTSGEVSRLIGTGSASYVEGSPATARYSPGDVVSGADGFLYVADYGNHRIRKIDLSTNWSSLIAGSGSGTYAEGANAAASFFYPRGIELGADGFLYVADTYNHRIRKINITTNQTYLVAGSGSATYVEGAGSSASFSYPFDVKFGQDGFLYVADTYNHRIRKINITTNQTYLVAGSGAAGSTNGNQTNARFNYPAQIIFGANELLYVADMTNSMIREVNISSNNTTKVAGTGTAGYLEGYGSASTTSGIALYAYNGASDNTIANNTAFSDTNDAIYVVSARSNVTGNNCTSVTGRGVRIEYTTNGIALGNIGFSNASEGIRFSSNAINSSAIFSLNNGTSITEYGIIAINVLDSTLSNNIGNSTNDVGFYGNSISRSNLTDNNGTTKFHFGCYFVTIYNSSIARQYCWSNTTYGLVLNQVNRSSLSDGKFISVAAAGANMRYIGLSNFTGNTIILNTTTSSLPAFYIRDSYENRLEQNNITSLSSSSSLYIDTNTWSNDFLRNSILSTGYYGGGPMAVAVYNNTFAGNIVNGTMGFWLRGHNNTYANNTIFARTSYACFYFDGTGGSDNNITGNTCNATSVGAVRMNSNANLRNRFWNNTFSNTGNAVLVSIVAASGENRFWWNNFTSTGTSAYVSDANGTNLYNATINGQPEGNLWQNVMNRSINVSGTVLSGYGKGLYVGNAGSGVPYNNSTSAGRFSCNFAGCMDYAPLTPTGSFQCSELNASGTTYNMTSNLSSGAATCFNVTAANITLDCAGRSIIGSNSSGTYGFYTNSTNTTVKNCFISNFSDAIRYNGAGDGTLLNNTLNTSFDSGSGIRITSNSHRASILQNSIYSYGNSTCGIFIDGGSNMTVDCAGRQIIGGNFSDTFNNLSTYGIYSSQYNTTVRNCIISGFDQGIYFNYTISSPKNSAIINTTSVSTTQNGTGILFDGVSYSAISNSSARGRVAIDLYSSPSNTIADTYANGTRYGIKLWYGFSEGNIITRCNASADVLYGMQFLASHNMVLESAIHSVQSTAVLLSLNVENNTFINNTLSSSSSESPLLKLGSSAHGNLFYWNNFTSTTMLYVNDSNGSNYYNTTINGHGEGNIYGNVMNGSVSVSGTIPSEYGNGLYVGDVGAGYPYGNSTSLGKFSCNFAACADYAPLTPYTACNCRVLSTPNYICNLTESQFSTGTCFNVTAQNVSIACNGYSIRGNSSNFTYGIYSSQFSTSINNCNISNFTDAIRFNGADNGTITNTNITTASSAGHGIHLANGADYNSISNITSSSVHGHGVYINASAGNALWDANSSSASGYYYHYSNNTTLAVDSSLDPGYGYLLTVNALYPDEDYGLFSLSYNSVPVISYETVMEGGAIYWSNSVTHFIATFDSIFQNASGDYANITGITIFAADQATNGSGIYLESSPNSTIARSYSASLVSLGIGLSASPNSSIHGTSTASLNGIALSLVSSQGSSIWNLSAISIANGAIYLESSAGSSISNITASSINGSGMSIILSPNVSLSNLSATSIQMFGILANQSTGIALLNLNTTSDNGSIYAEDCPGSTIANVRAISTGYYSFPGIQLYSSSGSSISNTQASVLSGQGIKIANSSNISIAGSHGYSNRSTGISLDTCNNISISGCNGTSNLEYGIRINWVSNLSMTGSNGTSNFSSGIYSYVCNYCTISNSSGYSSGYGSGLYFYELHNSTLMGLNGTSANSTGIYFFVSQGSAISDIRGASGSGTGIGLSACHRSSFTGLAASSLSSYGLYVPSSTQVNVSNGSISSNSGLGMFIDENFNNYYTGLNVSSSLGDGIHLNDSGYIRMSGCTVSAPNGVGLLVSGLFIPNITRVTSNSINAGSYGIYLHSSNSPIILANNSVNSSGYGIYSASLNNTIINNTITTDGAAENSTGIYLPEGVNHTIISNTVAVTAGKGIHLKFTNPTQGNNSFIDNNATSASSGTGIFIENSRLGAFPGNRGISASGYGIFVAGGTSNSFASGYGYSGSGTGIYIYDSPSNNFTGITAGTASGKAVHAKGSSHRVKIINANITATSSGTGLRLEGVIGINITNANVTAYDGDAVLIDTEADGNSVISSSAATTGGNGISVLNSANTTISNATASSSSGYGISVSTTGPSYTVINQSTGSTQSGSGIYISSSYCNVTGSTAYATSPVSSASCGLKLYNADSNTIVSSTLYANAGTAVCMEGTGSDGNLIYNNTVASSSQQGDLLHISSGSTGNTFYWNTFGNTSGTYAEDDGSGNIYNTSMSGQGEGNVWANVISGEVDICGTYYSLKPGWVTTYYHGDSSNSEPSEYPFNPAHSQGKLTGSAVDYAPMTPFRCLPPSPTNPQNYTELSCAKKACSTDYDCMSGGAPYCDAGCNPLSNTCYPCVDCGSAYCLPAGSECGNRRVLIGCGEASCNSGVCTASGETCPGEPMLNCCPSSFCSGGVCTAKNTSGLGCTNSSQCAPSAPYCANSSGTISCAACIPIGSPTNCTSNAECCGSNGASPGMCNLGNSSANFSKCLSCLPQGGKTCTSSSDCCSSLACKQGACTVNLPPPSPPKPSVSISAMNGTEAAICTANCPGSSLPSDPDRDTPVKIEYMWQVGGTNTTSFWHQSTSFNCEMIGGCSSTEVRLKSRACDPYGSCSNASVSDPVNVSTGAVSCGNSTCSIESRCCLGRVCQYANSSANVGTCCISDPTISCTSDSDCCSGMCRPNSQGVQVCVSGLSCGHACTYSSDCPSNCSICTGGICANCIPLDAIGCTANSQCCPRPGLPSGICQSGGTCALGKKQDETCDLDSDCLSNRCQQQSQGASKTCAPDALSCSYGGGACLSDSGCCEGYCDLLNGPLRVAIASYAMNGTLALDYGTCRATYPPYARCAPSGSIACPDRQSCTEYSGTGIYYCMGETGATHFYGWAKSGQDISADKSKNGHTGVAVQIRGDARQYFYSTVLGNSLLGGRKYLLDFWANGDSEQIARYAIFDSINNAYFTSTGTWVYAIDSNVPEGGIITESYHSGSYFQVNRVFYTLPDSRIELRFYPIDGGSYTIDDVSVSEANDFSMIAWLRADSSQKGGSVFKQVTMVDMVPQGIDWAIDPSGMLTLGVYSASSQVIEVPGSITPQVSLSDGKWHQVALSVDRAYVPDVQNYYVYLDGVNVASGSSGLGPVNSTSTMYIGAEGESQGFAGEIGEVRFYKRALTSADIADHYAGWYQQACKIDFLVRYNTTAAQNLSVYYNADLKVRKLLPETILSMPFDINVSSDERGMVTDYSRFLGAGTKTGAVWTTSGKYGGAYRFNGTTRIDLPSSLISNTSDFTVSAWINFGGGGTTRCVVCGFDSTTNKYGMQFGLDSSDRAYFGTGMSGIASTDAVPHVWAHIAGVKRNNTWSIYINGTKNASATVTGLNTGNHLSIGNAAFNSTNGYGFVGEIDEVRIFSRALSDAEVLSLYRDYGLVSSSPLPVSQK